MSEHKENEFEEQTAGAVDHNDSSTYEAAADAETQSTNEQAAVEDSSENGELTLLRKQAEEAQERFLRTQADFDNFRRRTRQEKEDFAKYASSKLVEKLLPVLDNFERAMNSGKDTKDVDALMKGIEMTFRQLDQALESEGLKRMDAVGQPFNPDYHQAIQQVQSEEYEEGTVVEELQRGYLFKDKVLRPAMVKVSE